MSVLTDKANLQALIRLLSGAPAETCDKPRPVARAFFDAEAAFRAARAAVSLEDVIRSIAEGADPQQVGTVFAWLDDNAD